MLLMKITDTLSAEVVAYMLARRGQGCWWCVLSSKKKTKSGVVDVLSYHLVPKMEIVSENVKKQILEKYDLKDFEQLPKFKPNDPSVKALGAKPGDVVKIYREDATGKYVAYRYVIAD